MHIRDEKDTVVFVLIGSSNHIHVTFNEITKCTSWKEYSSDTFSKMRNPKLVINKIDIFDEDNLRNSDCGMIHQFFFVNYMNQVQLLYPDYDEKFKKYRVLDVIASECNIQEFVPDHAKKIIVHSNIDSGENTMYHAENNVSRRHHTLKKMLNLGNKKITQDMTFQFVKDHIEQILYISDPIAHTVDIIFIKDHNCEECFMRGEQMNANTLMSSMRQSKLMGDFKKVIN
jgi:hypothetical protein